MATRATTKWIYDFADGSRDMRELLGGKGAGIAEMTRVLGRDLVPAGFTITTEACVQYMRADRASPEGLGAGIDRALARLEGAGGKALGDPHDPLLVSVRSGARDSMPGMMDTVLNLGLNDEAVEGLSARTGNPRLAWDSYRRLVHAADAQREASRAGCRPVRRRRGRRGAYSRASRRSRPSTRARFRRCCTPPSIRRLASTAVRPRW